VRNWEVRFALNNRHRQPDQSGPKRANGDIGVTLLDQPIGASDRAGGNSQAECWVAGGRGRSVSKPIAGEMSAIPVDIPALKRWKLLQGLAVAISRTTGVNASLFSSLSRCDSARGKIGVPSIRCPRAQREECKEYGGNGKPTLAIFHGRTPFRSQNAASLEKCRSTS
jgi:hypothetical protein